MKTVKILAPLPFLLIVIGAYYLAIVRPLIVAQSDLVARVEAERTKHTELLSRLQALSAANPKVELRDDLIWRSYDRADAELALQNQIIELCRANGLDLTSFQTKPIPAGDRHERISFDIEGSGELLAFYRFLASAEVTEKKTAFSSLLIRRGNQFDPTTEDVQIGFRARIWAFWEAIE